MDRLQAITELSHEFGRSRYVRGGFLSRVPVGPAWLDVVRRYETDVLAKRT